MKKLSMHILLLHRRSDRHKTDTCMNHSTGLIEIALLSNVIEVVRVGFRVLRAHRYGFGFRGPVISWRNQVDLDF